MATLPTIGTDVCALFLVGTPAFVILLNLCLWYHYADAACACEVALGALSSSLRRRRCHPDICSAGSRKSDADSKWRLQVYSEIRYRCSVRRLLLHLLRFHSILCSMEQKELANWKVRTSRLSNVLDLYRSMNRFYCDLSRALFMFLKSWPGSIHFLSIEVSIFFRFKEWKIKFDVLSARCSV